MTTRALPAGMLCAVLAGCAHGAPVPAPQSNAIRPDAAPDWIMKTPREDSAIYAVGIAGPTFYPDDAVRYAGDDGRVQLAHVLSSHVTSATLAVDTNEGGTGLADEASVINATHDYTDTIVKYSEVVASWTDKVGSYSGQQGTAYALVRMNLKNAGFVAGGPQGAPPATQDPAGTSAPMASPHP